eukprot:maker-scaffold1047_size67380-snap-gene-0.6 protein:Tk03447 transcript:maker-scaffold1047_size67380-snap-gene-0.6-mRNA-1 annotation:"hypothetical protein"
MTFWQVNHADENGPAELQVHPDRCPRVPFQELSLPIGNVSPSDRTMSANSERDMFKSKQFCEEVSKLEKVLPIDASPTNSSPNGSREDFLLMAQAAILRSASDYILTLQEQLRNSQA